MRVNIGLPVVRTDGRAYSHVITKFPRMGRLPHFLSYGASSTRALRARVELRYKLTEARNNCKSNSAILSNHLIISLAFRAFWKQYRIGRGCVYVADTSFKEFEVLGYLTGIVYWCFHRGVV